MIAHFDLESCQPSVVCTSGIRQGRCGGGGASHAASAIPRRTATRRTRRCLRRSPRWRSPDPPPRGRARRRMPSVHRRAARRATRDRRRGPPAWSPRRGPGTMRQVESAGATPRRPKPRPSHASSVSWAATMPSIEPSPMDRSAHGAPPGPPRPRRATTRREGTMTIASPPVWAACGRARASMATPPTSRRCTRSNVRSAGTTNWGSSAASRGALAPPAREEVVERRHPLVLRARAGSRQRRPRGGRSRAGRRPPMRAAHVALQLRGRRAGVHRHAHAAVDCVAPGVIVVEVGVEDGDDRRPGQLPARCAAGSPRPACRCRPGPSRRRSGWPSCSRCPPRSTHVLSATDLIWM